MRPRNDPGGPWSGRALSAVRRARGLTQADVALYCGVSSSTVALWERAHLREGFPPRADQVALARELLGCPRWALATSSEAARWLKQRGRRRTA